MAVLLGLHLPALSRTRPIHLCSTHGTPHPRSVRGGFAVRDGNLDHAEPGRPLTPELRKELIRGVLSTMVCSNPCGMGLPKVEWKPAHNRWEVTEKPYEWVFSMPACWNWEKTTNEYWCLTSCGNSYCVYVLKVSAKKDGVEVVAPIVPVFEEVRVHTFKLQGGRCGGGGVNESCTMDRSDEEFNPACGQ